MRNICGACVVLCLHKRIRVVGVSIIQLMNTRTHRGSCTHLIAKLAQLHGHFADKRRQHLIQNLSKKRREKRKVSDHIKQNTTYEGYITDTPFVYLSLESNCPLSPFEVVYDLEVVFVRWKRWRKQ